jgi:hypothetical protein
MSDIIEFIRRPALAAEELDFLSARIDPHHCIKKCSRVNAVCSVMRARINTTRLLQMRAQIARRGLLLNHSLLSPRPLQVLHHHIEWMQIDISIRTIPRAQAATDAPILNNDFQRIPAANRAHGTAHHT